LIAKLTFWLAVLTYAASHEIKVFDCCRGFIWGSLRAQWHLTLIYIYVITRRSATFDVCFWLELTY